MQVIYYLKLKIIAAKKKNGLLLCETTGGFEGGQWG